MGLSRTVSEINVDFGRKSQSFPTPVYLLPPLSGFPLEMVVALKNLPDGGKSLMVCAFV